MAAARTLLDLPDELIIKILDCLDIQCLVRCVACTCQRLNQLSNAENLWKKFSDLCWLDKERKHSSDSWKENFLEWHRNWGKYITCYAKVRSAWNKIESALEARSPGTRSSLKGPIDQSELDAIEAMMDRPLPLELACSYLIHNGQDVIPGRGSLLGNLEVYDHHSMEVAVPLAFNIKNALPKIGMLALSWCPYTNYGQVVCVSEKVGLPIGCVYYLTQVRRQKFAGYFVEASNYMEWLEKLATKLGDPELIVSSSKITRFYHEPSCVAVTRDVKVTVSTSFVPSLSHIWKNNNMRTLFAYRISMTMDENVPADRSCRLLSRHWEITDSQGQYHEVNGEAVIGLYPVMKPGAKFSYCSWTPLDSDGGFMEGHFTFVNLKTGENFDVICPRFNFKCPEIILSSGDIDDEQFESEDDVDDEDDDEY
ncbi:F-box only protein 3-like [Lytechinus variegatus]|uniref:F-box only protein 3-like n=1 Tax=Lytechinus variegatus TaxID=7654 RepID=UPI001BB230D9|nr:F-box only protein 3-like [Lytechinus variegatus]